MSNSITQDMAYRQSLMKYAQKYGVSRASRKYNKSRSYIYFWKSRWDGSVESLACQSRRPHSHPNQHTEEELKLIRDMRRRNPQLGMTELWHRLKKRGYTRCPQSLFRVMRKMGMFPYEEKKKSYVPKPYEQMQYPGQRVQVDVKDGKVERSHREDQKRFYSCHAFFSLEDFDKQLQIHNRRSNNIPMRPLRWLSPFEFSVQYV